MSATAAPSPDAARVGDALASGALLHPLAEIPGTVDLARAVAASMGVPGIAPARSPALTDAIGTRDHLVFVLVDGLGIELLESLPPGSFMRRQYVMELRAVFPSSTAPALTSLATARWPAAHGITGWWVHLPGAALTATVLPFTERFGDQPLAGPGVRAADVFFAPGWMSHLGRDAAAMQPEHISGSVYSRYFAGNRTQLGYKSMTAGIEAIASRIASADGPTFHYLYIPFVDTTAHERGPDAPGVLREARRVDERLALLADRLAGCARVIVSADHGQIRVSEERRHFLAPGDGVIATLQAPPSGEPRNPVFHVKEDSHGAFAAAFRARFGATWALLTVDEAADLGLYGDEPLHPETRRRLGDFAGIALTEEVMLYEPSPELRAMRGYHGGLAPQEMRIPLIIC